MSRDRGELMQELGGALRSYQRSVDAFDETVARHLGVNRTDLRALDVLLEQGQTTPGFLADAVGLTTGSVTAMLDRLEKLEYIERRPDPGDRRRVTVLPTARLLALAGKIYGPLVEEGGPLLGRYSRAELEMLVDLLQRVQTVQETHSERVRGMGAVSR
ncbi:MAG TPA: MarR family transcriptional regulator [Gemmatimonadales bacterium]|nr:MarR family transcriptional regulator [Gemmatimonadales bacterium]